MAGLSAWRLRYKLEAAYIHAKLCDSENAAQATDWLKILFREPGRKQRLMAAVDFMARGDQKFDLALMEFTNWPNQFPPHPVLSDQKWREFEGGLDDFFEAVIRQAPSRPELVDLFLHRFRYIKHFGADVASERDAFNMVPVLESIFIPDPAIPEWHTDLSKAIAVLVACRLTNNYSLMRDLSLHNWQTIGDQCATELAQHSDYLRFDEGTGSVIVDWEAENLHRPVDEMAIWVTHVTTPLPNWNRPMQWGYISPLWESLSQDSMNEH